MLPVTKFLGAAPPPPPHLQFHLLPAEGRHAGPGPATRPPLPILDGFGRHQAGFLCILDGSAGWMDGWTLGMAAIWCQTHLAVLIYFYGQSAPSEPPLCSKLFQPFDRLTILDNIFHPYFPFAGVILAHVQDRVGVIKLEIVQCWAKRMLDFHDVTIRTTLNSNPTAIQPGTIFFRSQLPFMFVLFSNSGTWPFLTGAPGGGGILLRASPAFSIRARPKTAIGRGRGGCQPA